VADFNRAVEFVLSDQIEGGYVDNPSDPGGATNFGISTRFLRSVGDGRDVRDLAQEDAIELYKKHFWNPIHGDELLDEDLAICLFDAAVNQGPGAAVKYLQECLNKYEGVSLAVDGGMGPKTLEAANQIAPDSSAGDELEFRYLLWRLFHYADLANKSAKYRVFIRGWLNRMITLFQEVE
jgi:lysozyme family protein